MENLDCPELIEEFEAKLVELNSPKRKLEHDSSNKKKKIVDLQVSFKLFVRLISFI